jgi:glycosyltransferase involved in cell wall biosynthesis
MHILIIGPTTPHRGGVAQFTTMLINRMRQHRRVTAWGFDPLYPAWLFPGNTQADPSAQQLTCQVDTWVHGYHPWVWWQAWRRLATSVDVVVWQWWTPYWIPFLLMLFWHAKRRRLRSIALCHQLVEPDAATWQHWLATTILGRADAVIFFGDEQTTPTAWPSLHRSLPLPVHHDILSPLPTPAAARQQLHLELNQRVFLCFGFVRPYKGLEAIIEALAQCPPECVLLIAGEWWPDAHGLRTRIEQSPATARIIVHDWYIPNEAVSTYFAAADVLLLPYVGGNVSGVSTLAAATGLPILCSQQGSIAGLAHVYEVVDDPSASAWAAAMMRVHHHWPIPRATTHTDPSSWDDLIDTIQEFAHVTPS